MSEHDEQCAVVEWLRWNKIPHFAIPNGGFRRKAEAARLRAEGVNAGVPDLCIPVSCGDYHGLFIEMKHGKNRATDSQKAWISYLLNAGYKVAVCYSAVAAIKVIRGYFSNDDKLTAQIESEEIFEKT